MKLVNKEVRETIVTIELTQRELNTLLAGLAKTTSSDTITYGKDYGFKVLGDGESMKLFDNIRTLAVSLKE